MVNVFLKATILTIIIFSIGVFFGYVLESSRTYAIAEKYIDSEISWNDARLLSDLFYQNETDFCKKAIVTNLQFADKIYEEGKILEQYEEANKLTSQLLKQKKKYALLQTQFLLNSIRLKQQCDASYNIIIYFYAQYADMQTKNKQNVISNLLLTVKEQKGFEVMLIPLPVDLDLDSVTLLKEKYGIDETPAIVINEKVYKGNLTLPEISKELK
ncbi:MAG: hypothetical protein QXQ79_00185 [Candidatus Nanoarchaeia archaeon]